MEVYQAGIKKVTTFASALWHGIGDIYLEREEWEKAIIAYRTVIAHYSRS